MTQTPFGVAFEKARARLQKADPQILSMQTAIDWNEANQQFSFYSLGKKYTISFPHGNVLTENGTATGPVFALLSLHYLLSKPTIPQGDWISFKEIPGGPIYQAPFQARTIGRLFRKVNNLSAVEKACERLDGKRMTGGNMAFQFCLFPRVPLGLVCWEGDEEFPPSGNILFDANAKHFLTAEDYAAVGEYLVGQIIKQIT